MRQVFNPITGKIETVISRLSELTDVEITSPQDQDRLEYDAASGNFVNLRGFGLDTGEPTGVIDTSETTLSVSVTAGLGGSLTVARTGASFSHYINGKKYTQLANEVFTIPAVTGLYFAYYDDTNTPTISTTPWDLLTDVPYSLVYYNNTTGDRFIGEERHGCTMDAATHVRLHFGGGAVYYDGFSASGYVLNSDTLANVQIELGSGRFGDEDITHILTTKLEGDNFDKWYRSGVNGDWRKDTSGTIPAFHATNIPKFNNNPGGGWQLTNVQDNYYFNTYIFATNSAEAANRFILVPGQAQYLQPDSAEQESVNSLDFGTLPTVEMIPIYKIRMQYRTVYTGNNARIRILEVEDLRGITNPGIAANAITHNSLGGRTDPDAHPTSAISMQLGAGNPTTVTSLDEYIDIAHSAGSVSGLTISATTPATPSVDVLGGDVYLRTSDSKTADLRLYGITSQTVAIASNDISYIYADYNAGTPTLASTTDITTIGAQSTVALAVAASAHGEIHHFDIGNYTSDFMADYAKRRAVTDWMQHGTGAMIAESGTRNISLTAGTFYVINKRLVTSAFDTSVADTFDYLYRDGVGGWTHVPAQTQIDNLQYDDGSGTLATLGNSKFAVHWVWLLVNTPDSIHVLYPQQQHNTLAEARTEGVPSDVPPELENFGPAVLVGRIIIQKSASSFDSVESPFDTVFTSSTALTHNSLSGIQGGALNEYYHLTANEKADFVMTGTTLNIGGSIATIVNIGRAGQTVNILGAVNNINATNVSVPNDLDVDGLLTADGGIDRSSAATLSIGATTASDITIGRVGINTSIPGTVSCGAITTPGTLAVTGSITVTGTVDGVDVAALKSDVDGFPDELKNLATAEIQQLENIGSTTISATQWGYLGGLNQALSDTSTVVFQNVTISSSLVAGNQVTDMHSLKGTLTLIDEPAGRVLITDGSSNLSVSDITSTELATLDGIASNIQSQLNSKQAAIATNTDNSLARYNGTSNIQGSGVSLNDSNDLGGIRSISGVTGQYLQDCITTGASAAVQVTQAGNSSVSVAYFANTGTPGTPWILQLNMANFTSSTLPADAKYVVFGRSGNPEIGSISRGPTTSSVAFNTSSDGRLKNKNGLVTGSLAKVLSTDVSSWTWIESGQYDEGFIAQELYEQFPLCVRKGDDDPTIVEQQWSVEYGRLTPYLFQSIQELNAKHEAEVAAKDLEIERLEKRIKSLEKRLAA